MLQNPPSDSHKVFAFANTPLPDPPIGAVSKTPPPPTSANDDAITKAFQRLAESSHTLSVISNHIATGRIKVGDIRRVNLALSFVRAAERELARASL